MWEEFCAEEILCERYFVCEESRAGGIPCGRNPVWKESHMGGIPCGRNPVWLGSRVGNQVREEEGSFRLFSRAGEIHCRRNSV